MNQELLTALIYNAALLLALSIVCEISYQLPDRFSKIKPLITGFFISSICIVVMSTRFVMAPGLVFDTRSILISVAAFFFGPIPTVMTVVTASIFRIVEGGVGMVAGLAVIVTSALIGYLWNRHIFSRQAKHRWLSLYLMSILVHIVMILCMLLMPYPTSLTVIREISLPVLLVYPVASLLLSMLLMVQRDRNDAINGQQEAQRLLSNSEKRFRSVVENAPEAIFIQFDSKFVFVNPETLNLLGAANADQLIGTPVFERFHPDYHDVIRSRTTFMKAQRQPVPSIEEVFIRLDQSHVSVDVSAVPISFNGKDSILVFCRDITARKAAEQEKLQMEAQLRQQQKMDAIGLLAGGVAHEINNPINGIMNYAQLVLDETPDETAEASWLKGIIQESRRISEIVKNLLQFSRQDKQSHSYARIEDIVNQTVSLLKAIFRKEQIDLIVAIPPDLPSVKCRSQQIQQVLLNLLTNARDALNEKYPGYHEDKVIRLSVASFDQDDRRWIRMTVEDHGTGISEEEQLRIFEPFYSTKPKDAGTGLGLSISFGIVRDHHGYFEVDSQKRQYTRIHCILPVDNGWTTPIVRED
ncbi:MAG: LytS/YhcK type 5TM receptor domain-containing protein [Bacillota bacterium]|nr:LytS/YhcK type 5TM receptor domain-containing protein [Bacillota bacterium]